jgi:hypothetical protein
MEQLGSGLGNPRNRSDRHVAAMLGHWYLNGHLSLREPLKWP